MTTETEMTDAELNERLARALGWAHHVDPLHDVWIAPGTRSTKLGQSQPPDYLTPDGMMAVIQAIRERGWLIEMAAAGEWYYAEVCDVGTRMGSSRDASLPRAVALAALQAEAGE